MELIDFPSVFVACCVAFLMTAAVDMVREFF